MKDIMRYNPFEELHSIRKRIEKLFDLFEEDEEFFELEKRFSKFSPAIDIEETENSYIVRAEVPGIDKNNLKIAVDENGISISGEKKQERKSQNKNYYRAEISYGKFKRYIPFPKKINPDAATAKYKNGIVEIEIPKVEKTNLKELEIKEEE